MTEIDPLNARLYPSRETPHHTEVSIFRTGHQGVAGVLQMLDECINETKPEA